MLPLSPLPTESFAEYLSKLPPDLQRTALETLTPQELTEYEYNWRDLWARPAQIIPGTARAAIQRTDWLFWLLLAGRGYGKTKTGAQTVREWAENPNEIILMIAPTAADVREVMIEGEAGLLSCYPEWERPVYNSSRHLVSFPSGAIGITRSADEPERLRGPQFSKFWADEIGAWRFLQDAWDQLMFGFRKKTQQPIQGVITTTPKPLKVIKDLIADPDTVITRGSSYENRSNIAEAFYKKVIKPYEGTRLGRQEINAELLEDTPGALWKQQWIDLTRLQQLPRDVELIRVVIPVDPAVSSTTHSDDTGIVPVALGSNNHIYVLEDLSGIYTALDWAKLSLLAYIRHKADRIVGEVNNGGDLVEQNLRSHVASLGHNPQMLPYRKVWASRGKAVRAEPVSRLYEQGMVHHIGAMPALEEEMTTWVPGTGMRSPGRMDSLVWGITDLVIQPHDQGVIVVDHPYQISPI